MPTITDSDTGHFAESDPSTILIRSFPLSNCGDWSNAALQTAITDSDAGSFTEAATVGPTDADSGHWADANSSARVTDTDVGLFTDAGQQVTVQGTETGTWADGGEHAGHAITDADTGHWADAGEKLKVASSDNGTWVDGKPSGTRNVGDSDGGTFHDSDGTVSKTGTGAPQHNVEAFSVTRASILNPATGIEAAQLTGVRSGSVVLQYTESAQTADDIQIGAWFEMTAANVTVIGGYLPFEAVALVLNSPVSGPVADQWSIPVYVEQMLAGAEVPLVLAATARTSDGITEALQIVLYRVRFASVTAYDAAYKNGIEVDFTGTALLSQRDETGAPLPVLPGGQSRYEIGRLVSSPDASGEIAYSGVPGPALQPAYGTGT